MSPTILQSGPYRLFFFSSDRGEPVHVHVARDRKAATFWVAPVRVEYHEADIGKAWHEHFGSGR